MLNAILGIKLDTSQKFTDEGKRIPVTKIKAGPCSVVQIKNEEKDGYWAVQLGWGGRRMIKVNQPLRGHLKGAGLKQAPVFLREIKIREKAAKQLKKGDEIKVSDVLQPGDKIKITGWSKGKGFTGVVKRWGFKGGPRTHGQSDRERAPGSIGQGTTPGRVFRGKKMPGRAGNAKVTISGLKVVDVDEKNNLLLIKGLVPGPRNGLLVIRKEDA